MNAKRCDLTGLGLRSGICRLRDYSALRASPFGAAVGRPTAFNFACGEVVEPCLFYVGGSNEYRAVVRSELHRFTHVPFRASGLQIIPTT
jgi:hypothetical protein